MEDLKKAVNETLNSLIDSDKINQIIEKQLTETIESIVKDQLRSYSNFGKALSAKIDESLSFDLNDFTFPEYHKVVLNLVEGALNNAVTGQAQEQLKKDLNEMFAPVPKEIKLSSLIQKFIDEYAQEYERDDADNIGLLISESEHGYVTVALHPKDKKTSYRSSEDISSWQDCDLVLNIRISKDDPKRGVLSHTYDRTGLKPHQFMPTCLHGVSRLMYQMYCAKSEIVFDCGLNSDDYETYYPELECHC